MINQEFHNFIRTQLNSVLTTEEQEQYKFAGNVVMSFVDNKLSISKVNQETLSISDINLIPFSILAFDGERIALPDTNLYQYTIPIIFTTRYSIKNEVLKFLESFTTSVNGKTFEINGINTAFGVTPVSYTGNHVEVKSEKWPILTCTLFAYYGDVMLGNNVTVEIGTTTYKPLSYAVNMTNDMSPTRPTSSKNYFGNNSQGKTRVRNMVLITPKNDSTWIEELENDTLNTIYNVKVTYPFTTPKVYDRPMKLRDGTATVLNGTSILTELNFVDG